MTRTLYTLLASLLILTPLAACDEGGPEGPEDGAISSPTDTQGDHGSVSDADTGPPEPTECPDDVDCADGLSCTVDTCEMPGAVCQWSLLEGTCLIQGVCFSAGDRASDAPCHVCDPAQSPYGWSLAEDGSPCDDGDACTEESCLDGECPSTPILCADDDPCTLESCDPASGCDMDYAPVGTPCDDGDVCTWLDACAPGGVCGGLDVTCDDGNACTDDACDPSSGDCAHAAQEGPCDDGDACTKNDACEGTECVSGPPLNCEDGNICTLDGCDPLTGCYLLPTQNPCCVGLASVCEDGNPCTSDQCDPDTASCSYEDNAALCDDGDACTTDDGCQDGGCSGSPISCDDDNPCTSDLCSPASGCVFTNVSGVACDDGLDCSTDDVCDDGVCGGDMSGCVCTPTFVDDVVRMNMVLMGDGGYPGEALDVDGDATTCSPDNDCEAGYDNALGVLASVLNTSLEGNVADGSLMLLLEIITPTAPTSVLALHQGELDPSNLDCDFNTEACDYVVTPDSIDSATCAPWLILPGSFSGDAVVAGGEGTVFPFLLPFQEGITLQLTIYDARFEGEVTKTDGVITGLNGILAGAIPKADLFDAIDAAPDDAFTDLPVDKAAINGLLDLLVVSDVDTTGDGVKDGASIALKMSGIPATITGVTD